MKKLSSVMPSVADQYGLSLAHPAPSVNCNPTNRDQIQAQKMRHRLLRGDGAGFSAIAV